ncbi:unnamed protein product [Owenia fusiformis]|uniref:Globin domain-containing protein n=1 Tax=Owenia fusiformis TaxID=6347 RepID=A0A8S4PIN2_OWEFU|nr:unnamed protein product [Owenia fusiformis]
MGCSSSTGGAAGELPTGPVKTVDPRLPFKTYRQLFSLKNHWKTVQRKMDATAVDAFISFFRKHPEHKALFDADWMKHVDDDNEEMIRESIAFENHAVAIWTVYDEVMEDLDGNVGGAIRTLHSTAKIHKNIDGFSSDFFKDFKGVFIDGVKNALGDRYTDAADENFQNFYAFQLKHLEAAFNK